MSSNYVPMSRVRGAGLASMQGVYETVELAVDLFAPAPYFASFVFLKELSSFEDRVQRDNLVYRTLCNVQKLNEFLFVLASFPLRDVLGRRNSGSLHLADKPQVSALREGIQKPQHIVSQVQG